MSSIKTMPSAIMAPNPSLNNVLSMENEYSSSLIDSKTFAIPKPTASTLVAEVLNTYFSEKSGIYEGPESTCSSSSFKKSSDYKIDERLRYWKETLADRRHLAEGIIRKTGKPDCDILFNKPATSDCRNVETIKNVLDYADRLNPTTLLSRKRFKLTDDPCQEGDKILETLPKSERLKRTISSFELVGIPSVAKEELAVHTSCQDKKYSWIKSKELERRIVSTATDIKNVFEFYPSFDSLQVVGRSVHCPKTLPRKSSIVFLSQDFLKNTSSSNSEISAVDSVMAVIEPSPSLPDYALKVNEKYIELPDLLDYFIFIKIKYECHPGNRIEKNILRLENVGKKVLDFGWQRKSEIGSHCVCKHLPSDIVFVFDKNPFRIIPGEFRNISIAFRPQHVQQRRETYQITLDPNFFSKETGLFITLQGNCSPTKEYLAEIVDVEREIECAASLGIVLGEINNVIEKASVLRNMKPMLFCPNTRSLDVREIFESINEGYKCCRYHDIELLQGIYNQIKLKNDPNEWNMNLKDLRKQILLTQNTESRRDLFAQFTRVVQSLQVSQHNCSSLNDDQEFRCLSKLQFIRSIFGSKLDRWEQFVQQLQISLLTQPDNPDLTYNMVFIQNKYKVPDELDVRRRDAMKEQSSEESFLYTNSEKVRDNRYKNYQDTLYIQTYSKLCDIVEDIVSIMESVDTM